MTATPQKEHEWLQQLVGEWTFEAEARAGPDKPAETAKGRESVRSLGGLWIVAEGYGDMPGGGTGENVMTLGFEPTRGRFVGAWVGSMMTWMWVYDGRLDASGKVLTLDSEGPAFSGEGTAKYQDVIEIVDPDTRLLRSRTLGEDGQWREFMVARYSRRKDELAPADLVAPDRKR
ncbi:DUF1579 domain-containing protein [Caulobacter sp. 17J80-11]|nr:DUF1579 domain-containing protein [Caulobacter sp. 17J80-11]